MGFKKLIKEAVDICIVEIHRKETKDKVLDPVIDCILEKIHPYILGLCVFLVTLVLLILSILFLIIFKTPKHI